MSKNKEIAKQIISSVQKHPRYKIDLYASIGNATRTHIDAVLCELESNGIVRIKPSCDMVQPTEKTAGAIIALDTEKSPDPIPSRIPPNVSIYRNSKDTTGAPCSLDAIYTRITTGGKGLKEKTKEARRLLRTDPLAYKKFKAKNLPTPTFAGIFPPTLRQAAHLAHHSGYIVLDIDDVPPVTLHALIAHLNTRADIRLAFLSPSGIGIKLVVHVSPTPQNAAEHTAAYRCVLTYFDTLSTQFNFSFDKSGTDCSRLCYLAHDPHAIYAPDAAPVLWDRDAYLSKVTEKAQRSEKNARIAYEGNIDITALDFIIPDNYDTWYKVGIACKNAEVGFHVWDTWSKRDPKYQENREGAMQKKWDSFTAQDLTWGTVVHLATQKGYVPPPKRKAPLQINTEKPRKHATARLSCASRKTQQTEDMQTIRLMLNSGVKQWLQETDETTGKHILNLTTGTGTGKTTAALTNIDAFIDISPTKELADEKYQKALEIKIDALRHKSRFYNHAAMKEYHPRDMKLGLEGDDTVPCVYPEICTRLYLKGHSPRHTFCEKRCERRDDCQSKGYLSQFPKYAKVDAVFFSFDDDIFSDPNYKAIIEKTGKDIMILDEADPTKLPIERFLNIHEAKQAYKDYKDFTAGKFLKTLLEKLALASTGAEFVTQAKETLAQFTDEAIEKIEQEFGGIPVRVQLRKTNAYNDFHTTAEIKYRDTLRKCAVIAEEQIDGFKTPPELHGYVPDSIYPIHTDNKKAPYNSLLQLNTAARLGFIPLHSATHIDAIPRNLTNLPRNLSEFIDSVTETETPPAHPIANGWEFYLNAQMNTKRGVLISASNSSDLLKAVYAHTDIKIETIDSMPPAWKDGNKCFQIATGRYTPAQSLIAVDTNNGSLSLKPRAREMLEIINRELQDGKETLIVTPKAFTSEGTLQHDPLIAEILSQPHAHVINHYHAEGINSFDSCQRAFIFHYEPRPDEIEKQACRIYRDKTLDFTRETTDFEKSGTVLHDVIRYRDPRVQAVFDRECEKRIYQALSRVRPELYNNKIIYLLTSEPIAIPVKTIFFTLPEMHKCIETHGTLTSFEDFLTQQQARSVAEIATEDNVTERTAYRRTETTRKETKASRDAEIIRLLNEGHSERKIAMHCKVSQGCVQAVLKKHRDQVT